MDRNGKPTDRFAPSSHPITLVPHIEALLKAPIPANAAPTVLEPTVEYAPAGAVLPPPATCGTAAAKK